MLFDNLARIDHTPKLNQESDFAFLNRSGREPVSRVRSFIESLLRDYPAQERGELCARIKSGNEAHFRSATFELLLNAILVRCGYHLDPHPTLTNGSPYRPDFLVKSPNGYEFYLEAVLASEDNGGDLKADARVGVVIDALANSVHKNFMVAIECEGSPTTQPSGTRLRSAVMSWLDDLDPDMVQKQIDSTGQLESAPYLEWTHEEWQVTFRPIPLKPERRGQSKTLLGILDLGGGGLVDAWRPLRNAVKFKGSKYGELDKPLLIAINFNTPHLDQIDELQALFGEEQFHFSVKNPEAEPRFSRAKNGAWVGMHGPQYTRTSGVWIFNDLNPYTVARRRSTLYFNPWAKLPLPSALEEFPHAVLDQSRIRVNSGRGIREIFGFPAHWPE